MEFTSEDLPLPDTPVTQLNAPSLKDTSMCFKLCSAAPRTVSSRPSPERRSGGTGI